MNFDSLYNNWFQKELKVLTCGKRKYLHFDHKINLFFKKKFFYFYFLNPKNIKTHSFYPFIRVNSTIRRYKKVEDKLKDKYVNKIELKSRPISYAAHFDSIIYSFYSSLLTYKYESFIKNKGIYDNVLAYLSKGKCNIDYSNEVFQFIANKGECVALTFDISNFFEGMDHKLLKDNWKLIINSNNLPEDHYTVFKSLTNYTYVEKSCLDLLFPNNSQSKKNKTYPKTICTPFDFRNSIRNNNLIKKNPNINNIYKSSRYGKKCGIPQGSPLSACLSNIYMINFDINVNKFVSKINGLYRRYSDDIIIIINPNDEEHLKNFILNEINNVHLEINQSKTEIIYFKFDHKEKLRAFNSQGKYNNLQYLGFEFNGINTYIRSSSYSRYYRRLKSRIRENLKAAYGKNAIGNTVFTKNIYNRYTINGKRNFITYAKRASDIMHSKSIKKQYKNNLITVNRLINEKKQKFELKKINKKLQIISKMSFLLLIREFSSIIIA